MHPATIGPYQIQRELGRGGMGEVFLARDTRLDRAVAIKALPAHFAADQTRLARFQREAKMLAALSHPSIGAIYGLEEVGGHYYLILEFIEGETLADVLKRGPIPIAEALPLARQIAEALEAAHEKGIIHRDLKPSNVMLTPEGVVKVLDFGLARTEESAPASSMGSPGSPGSPGVLDSPTLTSPMPLHSPTIPGAIMGTAGYMSPEQARGKPVDKRSDIFSFGCVLYEMLTGAQPFRGETLADAIGATLHKDVDLSRVPPSSRVRDLLTLCLAKDRKQRLHAFADATLTLALAIREIDRDEPAGGSRRGRSRKLIVGTLVMLLLITFSAVLWRSFAAPTIQEFQTACVSITLPSDLSLRFVKTTPDGRAFVAWGVARNSQGGMDAEPRFFVRQLDSQEFIPIPGTDGALGDAQGAFGGCPTADNRHLAFVMPVSPGATQKRLAIVPLDGSTPATTIADWSDGWSGNLTELANGDFLVLDGDATLIRLPRTGGAPAKPVKLDAGRIGVTRFELVGSSLPGNRGVFVNVVSYGQRGFQFSVGVLDPSTGRVKVVIEEGGMAKYSPTGHLLFTRGDVLLAVPFDLERTEVQGAPLAVLSGLLTKNRIFPARFWVTERGTLCYLPGVAIESYEISLLSPDGAVTPWSSEPKELQEPARVSPDGRRLLCRFLDTRGIDQLWLSPVDRADFVKLKTESTADAFGGIWSPDGNEVAYYRRAKDNRDGVYVQNVDTGVVRKVLQIDSSDEYFMPAAWLREGPALLLTRGLRRRVAIARLPLTTGELHVPDLVPVMESDANRGRASVSADGKLLAYISDETGSDESWVVELQPGGTMGRPVQVRTTGSHAHAWSPSGSTLFVEDARGRLMTATVSVAPQLSISTPSQIADLKKLGIEVWTPLPDGRFLVNVRHQINAELSRYELVLNWTNSLRLNNPTK